MEKGLLILCGILFFMQWANAQTGCGGNLQSPRGNITSPAFPRLYQNYLSCTWHITVDPGFTIRLLFKSFQTEACCDFVDVYDGDINANKLGRYFGSVVPPDTMSTDNEMTIVFTTDGSQVGAGFSAYYFQVGKMLENVGKCQPVDLVFILDNSGSIDVQNFARMKEVLINIVNMLPASVGPGANDTRVSVVTFDGHSQVEFTLYNGRYLGIVEQQIQGIGYRGGNSKIAAGIQTALDDIFVPSAGDRPNTADLMVIITDGNGDDRDEEITISERAKTQNISIITVGITNNIDSQRLREMASEEAFVMIDDFVRLETMTESILQFACKLLPITTTSTTATTTTATTTTTTTTAAATNNYYDYYDGYYNDYYNNEETVTSFLCGAVNIAVLLDTSGSIKDVNQSKTFAAKLVDKLMNSSEATLMSVVSFSEHPRVELELSRNQTAEQVKDVILNIQQMFGYTDLSSALQMINREDTRLVKLKNKSVSIVLVISDGFSNIDTNDVMAQATDLKENNAHIISIGTGDHINAELLKEMSSHYMVYDSKRDDHVVAALSEMKNVTCSKKDCEKLDIVFVVDSSDSINYDNPQNFELVKQFIMDFASIQNLGPYDTQIGMATFSIYGRYEFFLREGQNINEMKSLVSGVRHLSGATNISEGIQVARKQLFGGQGDRVFAKNIIILLSDGYPESGRDQAEAEMKMAKDEGIYVLSVGITRRSNYELLRSLSSNNMVVHVPDYNSLNDAVSKLVKTTCCSTNNACPKGDIVFVIDSSWSVLDSENGKGWNNIKQFVKDVVGNLSIEPYFRSWVSVIIYSTSARVEFSLQEGRDPSSLMALIDGIQHKGGNTNIAHGLELARQQLAPGYDRGDANDVIILLTDGTANEREGETEEQANLAHQEGAYIIGIGVSYRVNKEELAHISDVYYSVNNFSNLSGIVSYVVSSLRIGAGHRSGE